MKKLGVMKFLPRAKPSRGGRCECGQGRHFQAAPRYSVDKNTIRWSPGQSSRACGQPGISRRHECGCHIRPKVQAHVPGTDQCQGASVWTTQVLGSSVGRDTRTEYKVFLKRLLGAGIPEV